MSIEHKIDLSFQLGRMAAALGLEEGVPVREVADRVEVAAAALRTIRSLIVDESRLGVTQTFIRIVDAVETVLGKED